jgi:hypothetical protein
MALQKNIETNYGVEATYWKICITNFDWYKKLSRITIYGFLNRETRDNLKESLAIKSYAFNDDDFTFDYQEDIIAHAYNKLKVLPEWEDAEDV